MSLTSQKWIEILFLNQLQTFILAFVTIETQTNCILSNEIQTRIYLNPISRTSEYLAESIENNSVLPGD